MSGTQEIIASRPPVLSPASDAVPERSLPGELPHGHTRASTALPLDAPDPRTWRLALLALGALGLAIGIAILDAAPVGVAGDDAMYVILAKSMATGQGYRFLNLPGSPAATHFPPGYPALLAILWRIMPDFPANLMLFKAANAGCLALLAVGVARFARRRLLPVRWALAAALLTAISIPMLLLGTMLLSEPLFLALLVLLLPALESFAGERDAGSRSWRTAIVLGLAIGALLLVRTHAIALIPAAAIVLVARRRVRDAIVVSLVAIACLTPWQIWSIRHAGVLPAPLLGEYDSYLSWWMRGLHSLGWRMIPMTLSRTSGETAGMFAMLFSPGRSGIAHIITLVSLVGVGAIGLRAQWRRIPVTLFFLAGYLTIVALWPFPSDRFIWGVWPLFLLLLLGGVHEIVIMLRARPRRPAAWLVPALGAAAACWIAAGGATYETRAIRGRWWSSIGRENTLRIVPVVQWTLAHTRPDDLVAADDDGALYLYTGRHTVPARSFTVDQYLTRLSVQRNADEGLARILAAYPVRTVLLGSTETFNAAQLLASRPSPALSFLEMFPSGAAFTVNVR